MDSSRDVIGIVVPKSCGFLVAHKGGVQVKNTTIAVDIAKSVFEIAVSEQQGHVSERHRLSRAGFLRFFAQREPVTVLLEACGSAHHWARQLQGLGHRVVLLPPHAVRPYVPRNKTDRADARALLKAARNKDITPVPIKSLSQQALTALHRLRSAWLAARTARINTVRGLLREFGVVIPVGPRHVLQLLGAAIEDIDSPLPESLRPVLALMGEEIRQLEERIDLVDRQLQRLSKQMPVVARLQTIPGIGPISSTALVAFVGDVARFPSARHFASYLGLTPREHSSGLRRRLGSISKRGDTYLRMLLTHGARAVLWATHRKIPHERLRLWAHNVERLRGHNKAAIALANKMARLVWAVWKKDKDFEEVPAV